MFFRNINNKLRITNKLQIKENDLFITTRKCKTNKPFTEKRIKLMQ